MLCSGAFAAEALGRFGGRVTDTGACRFAPLLAVLGRVCVAVLAFAETAVLGRSVLVTLGNSSGNVLVRWDNWWFDLSSRMIIP
jgi:hypothetical protein